MEQQTAPLEQMGILGWMDPFTALNIKDRMIQAGAQTTTLATVKILWEAYQDAILEKKLIPFLPDADWLETFNDLVAVTGLSKNTVSAFLTSLRAHAFDAGTMEYLDPSKGAALRAQAKETIKQVVSAPGKVLQAASKPVIDTASAASAAVVGPLKWIAIGAVAVAVIYIGFQLVPLTTAGKKATKKKG